jgi:hypothetical protein
LQRVLIAARYLAVVGLKPLTTGSPPSRELEFHIISQGPPPMSTADSEIHSTMWIPIYPETGHPSREPLRPDGSPLTLPHCYYNSRGSTILLQISEVGGSLPEQGGTYLSLDDLDRLDTIAIEDAAQSAAARGTVTSRDEAEFKRMIVSLMVSYYT